MTPTGWPGSTPPGSTSTSGTTSPGQGRAEGANRDRRGGVTCSSVKRLALKRRFGRGRVLHLRGGA
jgi:hypothetical protein